MRSRLSTAFRGRLETFQSTISRLPRDRPLRPFRDHGRQYFFQLPENWAATRRSIGLQMRGRWSGPLCYPAFLQKADEDGPPSPARQWLGPGLADPARLQYRLPAPQSESARLPNSNLEPLDVAIVE